MRPIQANSDFYQNLSKADAAVTLTIHNPNTIPMPILDETGATLTTLSPGNTITGTFAVVKQSGKLHSQVAGACEYHGIMF